MLLTFRGTIVPWGMTWNLNACSSNTFCDQVCECGWSLSSSVPAAYCVLRQHTNTEFWRAPVQYPRTQRPYYGHSSSYICPGWTWHVLENKSSDALYCRFVWLKGIWLPFHQQMLRTRHSLQTTKNRPFMKICSTSQVWHPVKVFRPKCFTNRLVWVDNIEYFLTVYVSPFHFPFR